MPKIELRFIFGVIFISFILLSACAVKKDVKTNSEASVETKNEPSKKETSSEKTNSKYVDDRIGSSLAAPGYCQACSGGELL